MSTGADVAANVKRSFGDEAGVQITDDDILRWVNSAVREINGKNKVLKIKASATLNQGAYDYSTSGLNIFQVQTLHIEGRPLPSRSFQEAEEYILKRDPNGSTTGRPQLWYSWGENIYFWPMPEKNYDMSLYFIGEPTPLASITETIPLPDQYFNRIVEYVMAQAYELDEDNENSGFKLQQMAAGLDAAHGDDRSQNATYSMITVLQEDSGNAW